MTIQAGCTCSELESKFRSNHVSSRSLGVKDVDGCATGDVNQLLRGESRDYLLLSRFLGHELMLDVNILFRPDVSECQSFVSAKTGPGVIELAVGQSRLQGVLEAQ